MVGVTIDVLCRYAVFRVGGGYAMEYVHSDSEPEAPEEAAQEAPAMDIPKPAKSSKKFMTRTVAPASVSCGNNFCAVIDAYGDLWTWCVCICVPLYPFSIPEPVTRLVM